MIEIPMPETVKIGGYDYSVDLSPQGQQELTSDQLRGEVSHTRRQIRLDLGQSPQDFSNSFIHELVHSVDAIYLGHEMGESSVVPFANGLHQVLEQLGIRFVPRSEP